MKINFKGTYVIPGNAIFNGSASKLFEFLDITKNCRATSGSSYMDKSTGDYYISVKDDKETSFEHFSKRFKIPTRKGEIKDSFVPIAHNNTCVEYELPTLIDAIIEARAAKTK